MDLSSIPKPALIVASLTGLGAIAGGTFAMVQPTQPPDPIVVNSTVSPATTTPTTPPTMPPTIAGKPPSGTKAVPTKAQSSPSIEVDDSGTGTGTGTAGESSQSQGTSGSSGSSTTVEARPVKASRVVENCTVTMARVEDPNPPVNIRSKPDTMSTDTIITTAKNGTYLTVVDEKNDWFKISTPQKGWIAKRLTAYGCNRKTERVNFGSNDTTTVLTDEFIGAGSHDYRLRLSKGQKVRMFAQNGPLPTIVAPNGQTLHTMTDEKTDVWSGTLAESGDYRVIFDSNFKGYKYVTEIEARS
jgi:Bacterial SH3 domain